MKPIQSLAVFALLASQAALAGGPNSVVFTPQTVPAMSQLGLIIMSFVIGIAGARWIRNRRK